MLLAAIMWSTVGSVLLAVGTWWTRTDGPLMLVGLLAIAIGIGLVKARLVLRRSAQRISTRIHNRGDGRCLGGFISWQTWLMVLAMMLLGRLLRGGWVPRSVVAFIYQSVGAGLLAASIHLWQSASCTASASTDE